MRLQLNLPASASRRELVRVTLAGWPIGQHYLEPKDELGLDVSKDAVTEDGIIMRCSRRWRLHFSSWSDA
jgi:hypothetical protein